MKRNILKFGLAVVAILMLGACATAPGQFNGLAKDVMTMMVVYRTDNLAMTKVQYDAVVGVAKKMGEKVGLQLSSPFEASVASGVTGAVAGHFDSAGLAYGMVGIIGGLSTYSYAKVYAASEATEQALRDEENAGQKIFHRIHVTPAFVRSGNSEKFPAK
jgi:hypothetical protein